ncbi:MAG: ABC transporter substrate-binding protein [Chitinophagales bacterium]|nr:ABC transporter substrate-binding protein [Chitinophagales bacterium]
MKFAITCICACFLLFSCGDGGKKSEQKLTPAKGNKYYGGIFKMNEVEYFRSLFPLNVTEVTGHRITNQIYEGLVRFDQADLSIVPVLAESWEVDSTASKFVFHLRKGVKFHDDACFPNGKGKEVTANDFKYSLTKLCEYSATNEGYKFFSDKIAGCEAYYVSTRNGQPLPEGVAGVKVIDDYTLEISLNRPVGNFLDFLALPFAAVFPKEAVDKYGIDMREKAVGTGPFYIKSLKHDQSVYLARNESYWGKDADGNQLPYLEGIKVSFIKERKSELLEFKKGNLDMIYRLPLELTTEIVTKDDKLQDAYKQYVLQVAPSLSVWYLGFLNTDPVFSNKNLRIAFNYAIDRKKICEYTLKGAGFPAIHGIVPMGMEGYDAEVVKGYDYDPVKAREYLAKAGYPNGKGLPAITLGINSGGGTNEQLAEALSKMLEETLNIKVNITSVPFPQHTENVETSKVPFFRMGWNADYPDPETFLCLFYGKNVPSNPSERSYLNSSRYKNAAYDALYEAAISTADDDKRNLLYIKAEQLMMDDAPVMPIYYYKDHRLLQPYVLNFPQNAMEYRLLREVYFKPQTN